ncbi:PAS domain-containing protein [Streptomyces tricolor]|nr:PAS domain-containing protein [Streptomyces tricolor]
MAPEGLVVSANTALGDLLGADPATLVGRVAADLVDLASDARSRHAYLEVLRGRQARLRCTRRLEHPAGSRWGAGHRRPADRRRARCPCCRSPTSAPAANSRRACGTCRCTTR